VIYNILWLWATFCEYFRFPYFSKFHVSKYKKNFAENHDFSWKFQIFIFLKFPKIILSPKTPFCKNIKFKKANFKFDPFWPFPFYWLPSIIFVTWPVLDWWKDQMSNFNNVQIAKPISKSREWEEYGFDYDWWPIIEKKEPRNRTNHVTTLVSRGSEALRSLMKATSDIRLPLMF